MALIASAALGLAGQARAASYSPSDAFYWALPPGGAGSAIAVSPDGNFVYVADSHSKRIHEFASDGLPIRAWSYNKALQAPGSVTTDGFGDVYVLYPHPLHQAPATIEKFTGDGKKLLASWTVPFASAIAATRGGSVFVLTNFLNTVGEYNTNGKAIGGFVANLPGQWFPKPGYDARYWPQSGYDHPFKTVAREIAVDTSGNPLVVGDSYQALSSREPDCSIPDQDLHINTHPYPDPLDSGETARFSPSGTAVAHGWLSLSQQNCYNGLYQQSPGLYVAFGWQSDGVNPRGVAVDPNHGDVYAVTEDQLGARHLAPDLGEPFPGGNVNAPSGYGYDHNWDLIAGNPAGAVAVDCHSNLYMLGGGSASGLIAKFNYEGSVPPGSCANLSRLQLPGPTVAVFKVHVGKIGKEHVLAGCSGQPCTGTLWLESNSRLCRKCTLSFPHHFRIPPGLQRSLTLQLTRRGRRLLRIHPGLPIMVRGRLMGGHRFARRATLRGPSTLGPVCRFPGSPGGSATVSGTLAPGHAGDRITIQYLPPYAHGFLIPVVQRTVLTNRTGHFHDSHVLDAGGKWTIAVIWAGDRTRDPATPQPCSGTVRQIPTHISITCPPGSSVGTPSPFTGRLSGAPAGAAVALDYEAPPGVDIGHSVIANSRGHFSDSFSPPTPGLWLALAHYLGDAGHAPAEAVCEFTVAASDFSIAVSPSSGVVQQGGSVTATVGTAVTSGGPQSVSLSSTGSPAGATFSPASILAGGSSAVTFATSASTAPGNYTITVTGTGTSAHHSAAYTLTVTAAQATTALSLQCSPDSNRRFISCTGQLNSGGTGIGGAQIKLTYQPPQSGSPTVDMAMTGSDGTFGDTLNAPAGSLLASGGWQVTAQYAGDSTHAPASNTQSVTVP